MPKFNKVAEEHFIDKLRSRADGETVVDMFKEFNSTCYTSSNQHGMSLDTYSFSLFRSLGIVIAIVASITSQQHYAHFLTTAGCVVRGQGVLLRGRVLLGGRVC